MTISRARLRVLMQNRPNALSQRGGDTVVMERVTAGLRERGVEVTTDVAGTENPRDYDIVQLFNFATKDITEAQARNCVNAGTPFVVTTLYEDWPRFFNQSGAAFFALKTYVDMGQPSDRWQQFQQVMREVGPHDKWDNSYAAAHAAALIASGWAEVDALRRDYPGAIIDTYQCGCEVGDADDGGLFRGKFGVNDDFVLCVGRLETRKNQLMLLKALEDSDVTLVFATAGFTYQPAYTHYCQIFKRRGRTVFLNHLSPEELASAFAAARVHALPSWFELPGIVSLEAARYGTNVVGTKYGTLEDHLGDAASYCAPDSAASIYDAVMRAFTAPKSGLARARAEQFTWQRAADQHLAVYERALGKGTPAQYAHPAVASSEELRPLQATAVARGVDEVRETTIQAGRLVTALSRSYAADRLSSGPDSTTSPDNTITLVEAEPVSAQTLCDEANTLLRQGTVDVAISCLQRATAIDPFNSRAWSNLGVAYLIAARHSDAIAAFEAALKRNQNDIKATIGLASAWWNSGRKEEGFGAYVDIASRYPFDLSVLPHLVDASYSLDRLPQLALALALARSRYH